MDNLKNTPQTRGEYIENWYQFEKSLERIAGISLFFLAGLIIALDQPGDQWTLSALVASIAGGISLLTISRRPRAVRTHLNFLRANSQRNQAAIIGILTIILLTQIGIRPLTFIVGGVALLIGAWYQWRAYKIQKFDELFLKQQAPQDTKREQDL